LLNEYKQIQNFQFAYNIGVNENYCLFNWDIVKSANVLEEWTASIFRAALGGSSLQPQLGRLVTRHSNFTIDATQTRCSCT